MPKTVLLADDSVTAQNMGRRILTDAGYAVITVNNGSAALKKIHENPPDLIVLDVYMPGYGGLEVCQRLKESDQTMRIPVLLTVGKMEPFKLEEARRVRADAHIIKPFDASELLATLTKLEDLIVHQAEPQRAGRGKKSESKKSRFWQLNRDPAADPAEDPSGSIARLAELKRRQQEQPPVSEEAPQLVEQKAEVSAAPAAPVEEMTVAAPSPDQFPGTEESAPPQASEDQALATFASASSNSEQTAEFAISKPQYEEAEAQPAETSEERGSNGSVSVDEPSTSATGGAATPEPAPKPRWIAESVALSAEEASLALEQEMEKTQAIVATLPTEVVPETAGTAAEVTAENRAEEAPTSEAKESGAAFAATASASASSGDAAAVSSSAISAPPEPAAEPPVASEAAAAWENWQQIRDRVLASQPAEAIAQSVAEAAQASLASNSQAASADQASNANETSGNAAESPAPQLEGEALASIVDSVLAELKPKLMEQIAKKLAAEKK